MNTSQASKVHVEPSGVARMLMAITVVLILLSASGQLLRYVFDIHSIKKIAYLFDLDQERNVPTFFSVLLLFMACQLLTLIAWCSYHANQKTFFKWLILAAGFLFMAFDEAMQIHERLIVPMREWIVSVTDRSSSVLTMQEGLGVSEFGILYFAWVIPGFIVVTILAIYFFPFVMSFPHDTRRFFVLSAICYLSGALGVELLGGYYAEKHSIHNLTYSMITTLEEGLEILGVIVFIQALLKHIATLRPGVTIFFSRENAH